jgi:hypothetical protein
MYDFRAFRALAEDVHTMPTGFDVYNRLRYDKMTHPQVSPYLEKILESDAVPDSSLWTLVESYHDSACSDPRDLVFGLLALADDAASRAIRPDYTKSDTSVLLQLLEAHASAINMETAFNIAAAFCLGPYDSEIAAMLHQRRKISCHDKMSASLVCNNPDLIIPSSSRISVRAHSYCKVWQDAAGTLVAPLVKVAGTKRHSGHDFQIDLETTNAGVSIHAPSGTVLAVADMTTQRGDVLLFFSDDDPDDPLQTPLAGLVIRPNEGNTQTIVGQFVFEFGVRPCAGIGGLQFRDDGPYRDEDIAQDFRCECLDPGPLGFESWKWLRMHGLDSQDSPESSVVVLFSETIKWDTYHNGRDQKWSVYMSPEDLLLFVAQDLKVEEGSLERNSVPSISNSMHPEETVRRLATDVTSDGFSSYAVCEHSESDAGWLGRR